MKKLRVLICAGLVFLALAWILRRIGSAPVVQAQQSDAVATLKAEARLVLVDTVVTDKKGNYIHDLAQKDFRVWEDNKEQTIKSFSHESVSTITYEAHGKQYVAVMTGDNLKVPELSKEVPELRTPAGHNAIYVFALP